MGRPIFLNLICDLQVDRMLSDVSDEDNERYMIKLFETFQTYRLPMSSKVKGKLIEQGMTIMNIRDVGLVFTNRILKYIKMTSKMTSNYFPETLGKMYVLNASTMFSVIWALVKPFIDEKTKAKIVVLGDDFLEKVLEDVEADNLPKFLGGNCECEGGCINSDIGPWNPTGNKH